VARQNLELYWLFCITNFEAADFENTHTVKALYNISGKLNKQYVISIKTLLSMVWTGIATVYVCVISELY
jgi:hypothetical protein